jgi:hypothetical protein
MPANRVGDAYICTIPDNDIPMADVGYDEIGEIPEDSYHVTITGHIDWDDDPTVDTQNRGIETSFVIEGWDSVTNQLLGAWDGVVLNWSETSHSASNTHHSQPIVQQGLIDVPPNSYLRFQKRVSCNEINGQNGCPSVPFRLNACTIVFVIVTPKSIG